MLGSPIAHSRSPQLHLAAYRALGLDDWTYDRIECTRRRIPSLVGGFGPEWVGVSVTMPASSPRCGSPTSAPHAPNWSGSANTLVRHRRGWRADNTDIDGVDGCVGRGVQARAAVLGSGGTAPAVVVGLAELGRARHFRGRAQPRTRRRRCLALGPRLGVDVRWIELGTTWPTSTWSSAPSPPTWLPRYANTVVATPLLLDAIYDPWPTPLAAAVEAAGGRVISGLQMLLHQAFAQVEQFTGLPAPTEAMRAALNEQ